MTSFKYPLVALGLILGSEIIFKSLRKMFYTTRHPGNMKSKENEKKKKEKAVYKVLFFPDEGIISRQQAGRLSRTNDIQDLHHQAINSSECLLYQRTNNEITSSVPRNITAAAEHLKHSTSLAHMIEALDEAQRSIDLCLYTFTCRDLIGAVIRAKQRGVKVRLMMDRGMAETCSTTLTTLQAHSIPILLSHSPSSLMHHKFAIIDSADSVQKRQEVGDDRQCSTSLLQEGGNSFHPLVHIFRFMRVLMRTGQDGEQSANPSDDQTSLLMTGSLNWTWSAVVSNNENVVITSDLVLIQKFSEEFEKLWVAAKQGVTKENRGN